MKRPRREVAARVTAALSVCCFACGLGCGGNGNRPYGTVDGESDVVYVSPSASEEGDGTRTRPFLRVVPATESVREGGLVVLASGTYDDEIVIDRAMTLTGVDRELVIARAIRVVGAGPVRVENLTLRAGAPAILVTASSDVTVENVAIESAQGTAVSAKDARLSIVGVSIRGVSEGDTGGHGIFAEGGAVAIRGSTITGAKGRAVYLRGLTGDVIGSRIEVGGSGIAVTADAGVELRGNDVSLSRVPGLTQVGIYVGEARATVTENTVTGTATAVMVGTGGQATVARNRIRGGESGIVVVEGVATIDDNDIADISDRGISIQTIPTTVVVKKNRIARATSSGISLFAVNDATVEENVVTDTRLDADGLMGQGIYLLYARASLRANRVTGCAGGGIGVQKSGIEMSSDLVRGNGGPGVALTEMPLALPPAKLTSVSIDDNFGAGVLMMSGRASMTGVTVAGTRYDRSTGFGEGIAMTRSALTAERLQVERSTGNGLFVSADSTVALSRGSTVSDSGKFGMMAGCDAQISVGDTTFTANRLGDRNVCQ